MTLKRLVHFKKNLKPNSRFLPTADETAQNWNSLFKARRRQSNSSCLNFFELYCFYFSLRHEIWMESIRSIAFLWNKNKWRRWTFSFQRMYQTKTRTVLFIGTFCHTACESRDPWIYSVLFIINPYLASLPFVLKQPFRGNKGCCTISRLFAYLNQALGNSW